jgi:hypothetical protein
MNFDFVNFFKDTAKTKWMKHKAIEKLIDNLNFESTCGYITLVNTEVPDIGN